MYALLFRLCFQSQACAFVYLRRFQSQACALAHVDSKHTWTEGISAHSMHGQQTTCIQNGHAWPSERHASSDTNEQQAARVSERTRIRQQAWAANNATRAAASAHEHSMAACIYADYTHRYPQGNISAHSFARQHQCPQLHARHVQGNRCKAADARQQMQGNRCKATDARQQMQGSRHLLSWSYVSENQALLKSQWSHTYNVPGGASWCS